jgi:acetyltransferase-like isoleucine patch superfamily enzyme
MRRHIKQAIYAFFILLVLPLWFIYRLESTLLEKKRSFYGYSQFFSLIPGIIGNYLRFAFYRLTLAHVGDDACICFGVTMADPGIHIGTGAYVGPYCNLGLCTIGDDVLLGTDVHIISGFRQHGHSDLSIPFREQEGELLNVKIGEGTWIGNKAVVGNHVGERCIIGAASLVNREIPPYSIAAGNPAKIIRDRRNVEGNS